MKYSCVDPVEFLYPDITEYKSGTDKISILTPRGSYACAQVMLTEGSGSVEVSCDGWNPEIYEMLAIPVETSDFWWADPDAPHTPERKAPFEVYDCLKPYCGSIEFKDGVAAVYFSLWIPEDAPAGIMEGLVKVGQTNIPVTIEVSSAVVPKETLSVIMIHNPRIMCNYHNVKAASAEFEQLESKYFAMLRRMRQNILALTVGPRITDLGDNKYEFDFTDMEKFINKAISYGFTKFRSAFGRKVGKPESARIFVAGKHCMSYEGYSYIAQYLTALNQFLKEHGWSDRFLLSVCDEPNKATAGEYRALCGIIRKFFPGIKLVEATGYGFIEGSIDILIPMNAHFDKHEEEYDAYRKHGDEIWYYDCMGPRGEGYINRFMDYTLLSTRYHGWGNYAHDLTGYLHWAVNSYQPGQDPFTQSVPIHKGELDDEPNAIPAGDTHIIYPGEDGPWMSVRLENYRAGYEEYEMLRAIAEKDKKLADDICKKVFRRFNDVEYDPVVFRTTRNELIRAMEK